MSEGLLIDAEHPWPWLEAFPEYAAEFFNGRDEDAEALLRCVLAAPVTVLFGKSGLGKSSLLQAGLFPGLRNERLLPVYVRLAHESAAASASEQIAKRLEEEIRLTQHTLNDFTPLAYRLRQATEPNNAEVGPLTDSPWAELHRADIELADAEGLRWHPIFVLDQFEETFTLAADTERQKQIFYELGDLMENRIPKALAERLHADDELFDRLNLDTQNYRFLLSLREDYLADLEEWADLIPRLGPNRYRLLPLSEPQAISAVEKTGGALVSHEDAKNIIHYLSQTQVAAESDAHRRRGQTQVEPTLLSLMCSGLNEERLKHNKERLATGNLAKEGGLIVERFYDTAFDGLPEMLRDFVEQRLITADGVRLPYPVQSVLAEKLVTAKHIDALVNRRLIRRESLEEGDRIELVHDRLAQVALQRRQENQRRKEALKQQRLRLRWWIGTAVFVVLLVIFAGFMAHANLKAKQALEDATAANRKAKQALKDATALRLTVEGSAIISGQREGGPVRGLFKVLAGHRLSRSANTDEALRTETLKFSRQVFVRDNSASIFSVAFSPDGSRIVSGSMDNTLRLWDAKTGQPIGQPMKGHQDLVISVAFSPDGARIVSGSRDNTLRLWDANTGQPIGSSLTGHEGCVSSVAFSPDGSRIVSGSWDTTLRLWDAKTGQTIGPPLKGHEKEVASVAFSPDGSRIVSGSGDNTLRLWDANTGRPIGQPLEGHESNIFSVAFSPDGSRIVSGSGDKTLRLWDANTGETIAPPLKGHVDWVLSVAFSPDGSRIVSGSEDMALRLWDANTSQLVGQPFQGHKRGVYSVAFSPNGSRIVSGSEDNTLRLWDAKTGAALGQPLEGHTALVNSVAFSPDGSRIVSGSGDNTLRLWDAKTGAALGQPLIGHEDAVSSVAFSPDSTRIVSGSGDKTLRIWDAKTGQAIGPPLKGHEKEVTSVAFSPDGSRIVSGSDDNTLRLWDAKTGTVLGQPLRGHEGAVAGVAFSPDGTRVVSGSWDRTLRLWDANTGKPIGQPLKSHDGPVNSVAFSPDGKHIVSGSDDKTLRLWDVFEGWADALCAKLPANPTQQEWDEWVSPDIDYVCPCPGLPGPPACDRKKPKSAADRLID